MFEEKNNELRGNENIVPAGHSPHGHIWFRNLESEGSRKASFECISDKVPETYGGGYEMR